MRTRKPSKRVREQAALICAVMALGGCRSCVNAHEGGARPMLSACGEYPAVVGDDLAMRVDPGANATSCEITFARPWELTPRCSVVTPLMEMTTDLRWKTTNAAITMWSMRNRVPLGRFEIACEP